MMTDHEIVITSRGQKIEFARNKRLLSDKLYSARVDVYFFVSPAKLRIIFDDFVKREKNLFSIFCRRDEITINLNL